MDLRYGDGFVFCSNYATDIDQFSKLRELKVIDFAYYDTFYQWLNYNNISRNIKN